MSLANHPAPWSAEIAPIDGSTCIVDAEGSLIEVFAPDVARLIAAAPDFLASAASLVEAWDARTTTAQQIITGKSDRDLQKQAMDAIEGLRAAIAKATGGEA